MKSVRTEILKMRNDYRVLVWEPEGKSHLLKLDVEGKMILKWMLKK
jgi:hypothetical protein